MLFSNILCYKIGTITSWVQVLYSQYRKRNCHSVGLTISDQLRNCKWHVSQRQKWVLFMEQNWVMFFHFCCVFISHVLRCTNSNVKDLLITLKVPPGNLHYKWKWELSIYVEEGFQFFFFSNTIKASNDNLKADPIKGCTSTSARGNNTHSSCMQ